MGLAYLAEDLRLADDHRLESGCDGKEMCGSVAVGQHRDDGAELPPAEFRRTGQLVMRQGARPADVGGGEVDLAAVAGGEDGRFSALSREPRAELARESEIDVGPLAKLHRSLLVRHADHDQAIAGAVGRFELSHRICAGTESGSSRPASGADKSSTASSRRCSFTAMISTYASVSMKTTR
jgi:hypothetical protein